MGEHLQLTRGPLRDWWDGVVKQSNPQYRGGSTQGYYILGGDGRGLTWDNYPPRLPQFLERGLALHRNSGARKGSISTEQIRAAAPAAPPPGTSIIRLYTRIRPLPAGASPSNQLLGRDYMWVLADEIKELLSASRSTSEPFKLPPTFVGRLVVFHLVDNVRGQVWPWQPASVRSASFTGRKVREAGGIRTLSLTGRFAKDDSHPPAWNTRGLEGTFEAELDLDVATARISRLRGLADCRAWSDATYDRGAPPPSGKYPLRIALMEAKDELSKQITPEQAGTGAYYLRATVVDR